MRNDVATTNAELIEKQFSELCDRHRDALLASLKLIISAQLPSAGADANDPCANDAGLIARIKTKEFISPAEAAELFGCSAQHMRNLVQRAIDGKASEPIPFRDLDGVIVFPMSELMRWSEKPKQTPKGASRKNKTHLKAVAS